MRADLISLHKRTMALEQPTRMLRLSTVKYVFVRSEQTATLVRAEQIDSLYRCQYTDIEVVSENVL